MCAQVPTTRLNHDSTSNDELVNDDAAASSILTAATKNAPATAANNPSTATILSTATARVRLHPTPSDEPSLLSKRDDAGSRSTSAGTVLTAGSGLGLSVLRPNYTQKSMKNEKLIMLLVNQIISNSFTRIVVLWPEECPS